MKKNYAELSKQIDQLYAEKKYDDALSLLIESKNLMGNGIFYYNLGTISAKKGDLAAARFNFELALKNGHVGPEILKNMATVNSKIATASFESNEDSYLDRFNFTMSHFPGDFFITISLSMVIIILLLKKFSNLLERNLFFILIAVSFVPFMYGQLVLKKINTAIVLRETSVKEGPSKIFDDSSSVPEGTKVVVQKRSEQWYYIKYPQGFSGWISSKDLGVL